MRIAYFDCVSGISGDMTLGALLDAGASLEKVQQAIHAIGLDQVRVQVQPVKKCGFRALHVKIEHPPEKAHRHLHHIEAMFDRGNLEPSVRQLASRIFLMIGEAEAKVHGTDLKKVHFHEVGAVDSIADILGVSVALVDLGIDRVESSAVPTGQGTIVIDHGRVAVPAPATAELLRGVPLLASDIEAELTTPTGAGILKATCQRYGGMPSMNIQHIGYGAGTRDLVGQANVLRVTIGESVERPSLASLYEHDRIWVLETNIDDVSAADVAVVAEQLMQTGALDVCQTPCTMKKGRSGVCITVLADDDKVAVLERILFQSGVTIGVRRWRAERSKLPRKAHRVLTQWGSIEGKLAWLPEGRWKFNPELESLKQVAQQFEVSLHVLRDAANAAFLAGEIPPPP